MGFSVPSFPLLCGVYTGPFVGRVFRFDVMANLAFGRRVSIGGPLSYYFNEPYPIVLESNAQLLTPAGTDLRDQSQHPLAAFNPIDIVEVPALSGRWYLVTGVDDIGKGFPNEHRSAWLVKAGEYLDNSGPGGRWTGCIWPIPMP